MNLTNYQQQIYDRAIKSPNNSVMTIRGYAGTGKTHTVMNIIGSYSEAKRPVLAMAPTAAALGVIKKKIKGQYNSDSIQFKTVASLVKKPINIFKLKNSKGKELLNFSLQESGINELKKFLTKMKATDKEFSAIKEEIVSIRYFDRNKQQYVSRNEKEIDIDFKKIEPAFSKLGLNHNNMSIESEFLIEDDIESLKNRLQPYACIIIDEMSMVNNDEAKVIYEAVKDLEHTQTIFVGDRSQLQPVNGQINHYMKVEPDDEDVFELTDILRSSDDIAKIGHLINQGTNIFKLQKERDDIIKRYNEHIDSFIKNNIESLNQSNMVLSFTNYFVNKVNKAIRAQRGYNESLVEDEVLMVTSNTYAQRKDGSKSIIFSNGESVKIEKIFTNEETAKMLEGQTHEFKEALQTQDSSGSLDSAKAVNASNDFRIIKVKSLDNDTASRLMWIPTDLKYRNNDYLFRSQKKSLNRLGFLNDGEIQVLDAKYGYARTIHKSQGSEWSNVDIILTEEDIKQNKESKELLYTAATRPKEQLRIHIIKKF